MSGGAEQSRLLDKAAIFRAIGPHVLELWKQQRQIDGGDDDCDDDGTPEFLYFRHSHKLWRAWLVQSAGDQTTALLLLRCLSALLEPQVPHQLPPSPATEVYHWVVDPELAIVRLSACTTPRSNPTSIPVLAKPTRGAAAYLWCCGYGCLPEKAVGGCSLPPRSSAAGQRAADRERQQLVLAFRRDLHADAGGAPRAGADTTAPVRALSVGVTLAICHSPRVPFSSQETNAIVFTAALHVVRALSNDSPQLRALLELSGPRYSIAPPTTHKLCLLIRALPSEATGWWQR